jgi:hypothetical protein
MHKNKDKPIEDYVFVLPTGDVRRLGPDFPENLDQLGVGKLIGFPEGIDENTKSRLIRYAVGDIPRARQFRKAGAELYLLQSASVRSQFVEVMGPLSVGIVRGASLLVAMLVVVSACLPMTYSALNPKSAETLRSLPESFLAFAIKEHVDDKYKADDDLEKAKADKQGFENWRKENANGK